MPSGYVTIAGYLLWTDSMLMQLAGCGLPSKPSISVDLTGLDGAREKTFSPHFLFSSFPFSF